MSRSGAGRDGGRAGEDRRAMRRGPLAAALAALAALACGAGCRTFWHDAFRNLAETPVRGVDAYCTTIDCRAEAQKAWAQVEASLPAGETASPDFAKGFQDGFAEYLDIGGKGQPPAVPPFCYQLRKYQSVAGHQAIQAWYAGYAAGADAAKASGLRELIVIPLSAPPINVLPLGPQPPPWYPPWTRLPAREVPPRPPQPPAGADLPPPQPVEPGAVPIGALPPADGPPHR